MFFYFKSKTFATNIRSLLNDWTFYFVELIPYGNLIKAKKRSDNWKGMQIKTSRTRNGVRHIFYVRFNYMDLINISKI